MSPRTALPLGVLWASTLASAALAAPQGRTDYLNFESPQVKPIAVARVDGRDWVLACNTPDDCVEVYDADTLAYVLRVPTGQEPVSVRFDGVTALWTANTVGDSVTRAELFVDAPGGPLRARLDRTVYVGDEPMDLAFLPSGDVAVSLNTRSGFAVLDATFPIAPAADPVLFLDDPVAPGAALKEARTMLVAGTRLFALAHRGMGNPPTANPPGLDLYSRDLALADVPAAYEPLTGIGTTNFNMAMDSGGRLWVVSTEGENQLVREPAVAAAPFGFARSVLSRIPAAGTPAALIEPRDLNLDEAATPPGPTRTEGVCQPTDLVLYEVGGRLAKVYVASFGTDRVAVVSGDLEAGRPEDWSIDVVDVRPAPATGNPLAGPRGLAVRYGVTPADDRIFVLNRLDNSIAAIDPSTDTITPAVPLRHDPTPKYVRHGRRFLYDGKLSRTQFVSCASCHVDGRLDGLTWNLGTLAPDTEPIPAGLLDGVIGTPPALFPNDKGVMVTQSLQGLATWEVEPGTQAWFSGAPFHWRGDRAEFVDFQGAFQSLLAGPGVTAVEMESFRDFVASIHFPPNPEQPMFREYEGDLGDVDLDDGSGTKRGLKLFHTLPLVGGSIGGRSCSQCHALPDGSNDRITMLVAGGNGGPMLSALLRGIEAKERFLVRPDDPVDVPEQIRTGIGGMLHSVAAYTINGFLEVSFASTFDPGDPLLPKTNALNQFVRQLDTGTAPMVGRPWTVDLANVGNAYTLAWTTLFEAQAEAGNVGVAVQASLANGQRAFWYDASLRPPAYRQEGAGSPGATWSRAALLGLVTRPDDRLVFQATGLGNERRVSLLGAAAAPLPGPAPSSLELLEPMPNAAYADVPLLTKNWDTDTSVPAGLRFEWDAVGFDEPRKLLQTRIFQRALRDAGFLGGLRHEPSRRLRLCGTDIRHGARLRLSVADGLASTPLVLEMPLYATGADDGGRPVWTTAAELEPLELLTLMLGGPEAPLVQDVLDGVLLTEFPPPAGFDPATWNRHTVEVVNADGTRASAPAQVLQLP